MQATAAAECGVTDLLEKILDKGLVIHADLMISLAGVPLIGVSLKAAIAGMETMLKYGMLNDWDEKSREWASKEREKTQKVGYGSMDEEYVLVKMFCSHWYSRGIYRCWRPGHLYITDKRVVLRRDQPCEELMEIPYELIMGMTMETRVNITGRETDYLYISIKDSEVAQLHPTNASVAKEAIESRMKELGIGFEEKLVTPPVDEKASKLLTPGEGITHCGRMWHLVPLTSASRINDSEWKPGHVYLTNKKLCWYYDFEGKIGWETSCDSLLHVTTQLQDLGGMLKGKEILSVLYKTRSGNKVACFSGPMSEMRDWEGALSDIVKQRNEPLTEDWESCPQCEEKAPRRKLLREGCTACGWISPRLRREV